MKKRLLSIFLTLCIALTMLPVSAFAAQPEEALYAQMLELGLVDGDGALIGDNSFTVEDGTRLSSLDELVAWLNQCSADELDTRIRVDATGRSATAEQLMYALSIEYQMAAEPAGLGRRVPFGRRFSGYLRPRTAAAHDHDVKRGQRHSDHRGRSV